MFGCGVTGCGVWLVVLFGSFAFAIVIAVFCVWV